MEMHVDPLKVQLAVDQIELLLLLANQLPSQSGATVTVDRYLLTTHMLLYRLTDWPYILLMYAYHISSRRSSVSCFGYSMVMFIIFNRILLKAE